MKIDKLWAESEAMRNGVLTNTIHLNKGICIERKTLPFCYCNYKYFPAA